MNRYDTLPSGFTAVSTGTIRKGDIVKSRYSLQYEDALGIVGCKITNGKWDGYEVYRLTDESLLPEFTIKNRFDGSVIYTGKGVSIGAVLLSAHESGADLRSADLRSANLQDSKLTKDQKALVVATRTIVPEEGDIIGFKKLCDGVIAKLLIPAKAKRVGGVIERKCRAEFAVVLEGSGRSQHDNSFVYTEGATVKPSNGFDADPFNVCAPGIHFFITRAEAEAY